MILEPFFPAALLAQAIQNNSFGKNRKVILNMIRDPEIIKVIAIKIFDFSAANTMKMMMFVHVRVETPRSSLGWNDIDQSDLGKRQQRSVYRVIGNIRKLLFDDIEHLIGCGMIFYLHELFVYRASLRSDLQIEFFAVLYELIKTIRNLFFLHIIIK
jgi:hypothetical protein